MNKIIENKKELHDIIKAIKPNEFNNTVDMHIHTTCSDGKTDPSLAIKTAEKEGYKIISITDHNTVNAYSKVNSSESLKLIKGVEFDCWYGYTLLHIIGYGIDTENTELLNICAKTKRATTLDIIRFFNRRKAKDVIKAIICAGGIPVLAHPACCWNLNLKRMVQKLVSFGLEGIEVFYPYKRHRGIIKFYTIKHVENIADELNLLKTGGSDKHD